MLSKIIDRLLDIYNNLALIRQDPGLEHFEVAERVLQCNANNISQQLPTTDDVEMATVISKKALHEFLLTRCRELIMDCTSVHHRFWCEDLTFLLWTIMTNRGE